MRRQQQKCLKIVWSTIACYITFFCNSGAALGQTQIITADPIIFPPVGQSTYVLSSGQSLVARSGQSVTLNAGTTIQLGASVLLEVDPNITGPIDPGNNNPNADMNWVLGKKFNANGQVISESKLFFDDRGRIIQSQSRNIEANMVLAVEPLYSVEGKTIGNTLVAPINNSELLYKEGFAVNGSSSPYTFRNFGRYLNSSGAKIDKTNAPDAVGGTVNGTLGWYYSTSNSLEPYQDITSFPYTMSIEPSNGTHIFTRSATMGDELRMGKNHETITFSVPITGELALYESIRNKFFTDAEVGGRILVDSAVRNMSVSLDPDRNVGVSISVDGRPVLTAIGGADLTVVKTINVASDNSAYFPVLTSQSVNFNGTASSLVDYVRNEAISTVSSGAVILDKGLYELRATGGSQTVSYNLGLGNISMNFYDQLGRLRATIQPEGVKKLLNGGLSNYGTLESVPFVHTFEYNAQGLLVGGMIPDKGRSAIKYNTEGKIRFSQNALQKQKGSYTYYNYDQYGRALQAGEYLPSGTGMVAFENITQTMCDAAGLPSTVGTQNEMIEYHYDDVNASHALTGYIQDSYFLGGKISYIEKYSQLTGNVKDEAKLINRIWYNYDGDGNVSWTVTNINGLGLKTMDYVYDEFGRVTKSIYQKNTSLETFVHYFEYDLNGKLKAVYTNTVDNIATRLVHAKYIYALTGGLKRIEYGDKLQGIDYVYTVDGKLKSVNNTNLGTNGTNDPGKDGSGNGFAIDAFNENIEYYMNDYSRPGTNIYGIQNAAAPARYSGLMNGIGWQVQKPSSVIGLDAGSMNIFTYDNKGQLLSSTWGTPSYGAKSFTAMTNVNQEKGLSYDNNGNILTLQRTNGTGTTINNFTYSYQTGTNKLISIPSYATYTYDAFGQLNSQVKGTNGMYMDYDVTGKISKVYSDAGKSTLILSFVYDHNGNRVMKKDHRTNSVNWYSYSGDGTLLAVFESKNGGILQLIEQPVYGHNRLGMLNKPGGSYSYTLKDHLGNTRAIISRNKLASGQADILYYADYYPFGMEARSGGIDSRYGYQGVFAEKDKETGWNSFELRNYDASIGRWISTDPESQYYSPYLAMGNNPISGIDPDGSWDTWMGAFLFTLKHGGKIHKTAEGKFNVGMVEKGMPTIYAGRGGNGFTSMAFVAAAQASQSKKKPQSWIERAYNAFQDLGSDHPYFHAPPSGEYGPYMGPPVYAGASVNANVGGSNVGLSVVADQNHNVALFRSYTASGGYRQGQLAAGGTTLDFYIDARDNNQDIFSGIEGRTLDIAIGYKLMIGISIPLTDDNKFDFNGVYKVSFGAGTGATIGVDYTKRVHYSDVVKAFNEASKFKF